MKGVHQQQGFRASRTSFARDTPPRSSDPELLMNPFFAGDTLGLLGWAKVLLLLLAFGLCSLRERCQVQ